MLNLDGAALFMDGKTFTYDLPEPFGPGRGPAELIVKAKPAAATNTVFRAKLEEIMLQSMASDLALQRQLDKTNDADAFVRGRDKSIKRIERLSWEVIYDACIVEWSSTIQNDGANIEATRENFIELALFKHKDLISVFTQLRRDLNANDKFAVEIEKQIEEDLVKN